MTTQATVSSAMRDAFRTGSGVDPYTLRVVVLTVAVGVVFLIAGWFISQIFDAYKNDRVTVADAIWGTVKTGVLVALLLWTMFS
jgi:integrating conjugative element protein (TIGR03758 family)